LLFNRRFSLAFESAQKIPSSINYLTLPWASTVSMYRKSHIFKQSKSITTRKQFKMKVSSLAVATLSLLTNPSCSVASSSSSSSPSRNSKFLPWTKANVYNPIGGSSAAAESESNVLLGQDEEASESLEVSIPLSQSSTLSSNDAPLTRDIAMLTEILSDLVLHENPKVHELCEEFIEYGRQR